MQKENLNEVINDFVKQERSILILFKFIILIGNIFFSYYNV